MLRKKTLLVILTASISFFITSNCLAQKEAKVQPVISKTNIVLYNFDVRVSDMDLTSYYNIDKKIIDDFYKMISSSLASVNGLNLKPVNFLAGKINFDQYGYPATRGKKAVATNTADNYLSISVAISGAGVKRPPDESNPNDCVLSQKVAVRMDVTVFDKSEEKIFDEASIAKSEDKIAFHYSKFTIGKLNGTKPQPADTKILYDLMKLATDEMSAQKFPK